MVWGEGGGVLPEVGGRAVDHGCLGRLGGVLGGRLGRSVVVGFWI